VGFALTNTDDDMMVFDVWYDDYVRRYSPNVSTLSFEHQCKYINSKIVIIGAKPHGTEQTGQPAVITKHSCIPIGEVKFPQESLHGCIPPVMAQQSLMDNSAPHGGMGT